MLDEPRPARVGCPHELHDLGTWFHIHTEGDSDESVPYLPVTATVVAAGRPPLTLRLAPMLGERGFHYGADVALPERTQKITVAIGAATVAVTGSDKTRFKRPVSAVFDWATP